MEEGKTTSKMNKKTILVVLLNVVFILIGIGGAATGTIAWFGANQSVTATASTFQVVSPEGVNFDIYYLRTFGSGNAETDGNYNLTTHLYSGYELEGNNPNFYPSQENDGTTNIEHLWPAHKMTYALVINSGALGGFSLDAWVEDTTVGKALAYDGFEEEVQLTKRVSLTWAIDMYALAYTVTATESVTADIATAYASYKNDPKTDVFKYVQTPEDPGDNPSTPINFDIVAQNPTNAQRAILLFSIEFSNDSSTFYEYAASDANYDYFDKAITGNSNCYEGLRFSSLTFGLH